MDRANRALVDADIEPDQPPTDMSDAEAQITHRLLVEFIGAVDALIASLDRAEGVERPAREPEAVGQVRDLIRAAARHRQQLPTMLRVYDGLLATLSEDSTKDLANREALRTELRAAHDRRCNAAGARRAADPSGRADRSGCRRLWPAAAQLRHRDAPVGGRDHAS